MPTTPETLSPQQSHAQPVHRLTGIKPRRVYRLLVSIAIKHPDRITVDDSEDRKHVAILDLRLNYIAIIRSPMSQFDADLLLRPTGRRELDLRLLPRRPDRERQLLPPTVDF